MILAPGAGAGITHEFMDFVGQGLGRLGARVCRFNFAYAEKGRRSPDRQPVLEDTYRAVVEELAGEHKGRRLVLGGKSMGGRIASHIVAGGVGADGLLFFGYPLHAPGRPDRLRDQHLYEIRAPMLFIEGTRDPFCPLETLEKVRARLTAPNEVAVIDDGDHSLKVRKSSERSTTEAWGEAVDRAAAWIVALP